MYLDIFYIFILNSCLWIDEYIIFTKIGYELNGEMIETTVSPTEPFIIIFPSGYHTLLFVDEMNQEWQFDIAVGWYQEDIQ